MRNCAWLRARPSGSWLTAPTSRSHRVLSSIWQKSCGTPTIPWPSTSTTLTTWKTWRWLGQTGQKKTGHRTGQKRTGQKRTGPEEEDRAEEDRAVTRLSGVVNAGLRRGDFFTCASERQRDFWLGSLTALGRVNPYTYKGDPLLAQLVSVVPFGLPSEPPRRQGPGLRDVVPGIGQDDKVVLWGGGVYNWLDPLSLLRAAERLRRRLPELRLVFLGMHHPNPAVPAMRVAAQLQELSRELGLTGKHVFFNAGWAPYGRRADFLLDADVAVSTHFDHIETRYSFRSRVLDYLWAGLPMVLTAGDVLADEVAEAGLGVTVPAEDDEALEAALAAVLTSPPRPELFAQVALRHTWGRAAQPLLEFCSQPRRASDQVVSRLSPEGAAGPTPATRVSPGRANPVRANPVRAGPGDGSGTRAWPPTRGWSPPPDRLGVAGAAHPGAPRWRPAVARSRPPARGHVALPSRPADGACGTRLRAARCGGLSAQSPARSGAPCGVRRRRPPPYRNDRPQPRSTQPS